MAQFRIQNSTAAAAAACNATRTRSEEVPYSTVQRLSNQQHQRTSTVSSGGGGGGNMTQTNSTAAAAAAGWMRESNTSSVTDVPRIIALQRGGNGFGFTIKSGEHVGMKIPCIDRVVENSLPFLAGIRSGDFVIEINGTNVVGDDRKLASDLLRDCRDILMLKVLTVAPPTNNDIYGNSSEMDQTIYDNLDETLQDIDDSSASRAAAVSNGFPRPGKEPYSSSSSSSADSGFSSAASTLSRRDAGSLESPASPRESMDSGRPSSRKDIGQKIELLLQGSSAVRNSPAAAAACRPPPKPVPQIPRISRGKSVTDDSGPPAPPPPPLSPVTAEASLENAVNRPPAATEIPPSKHKSLPPPPKRTTSQLSTTQGGSKDQQAVDTSAALTADGDGSANAGGQVMMRSAAGGGTADSKDLLSEAKRVLLDYKRRSGLLSPTELKMVEPFPVDEQPDVQQTQAEGREAPADSQATRDGIKVRNDHTRDVENVSKPQRIIDKVSNSVPDNDQAMTAILEAESRNENAINCDDVTVISFQEQPKSPLASSPAEIVQATSRCKHPVPKTRNSEAAPNPLSEVRLRPVAPPRNTSVDDSVPDTAPVNVPSQPTVMWRRGPQPAATKDGGTAKTSEGRRPSVPVDLPLSKITVVPPPPPPKTASHPFTRSRSSGALLQQGELLSSPTGSLTPDMDFVPVPVPPPPQMEVDFFDAVPAAPSRSIVEISSSRRSIAVALPSPPVSPPPKPQISPPHPTSSLKNPSSIGRPSSTSSQQKSPPPQKERPVAPRQPTKPPPQLKPSPLSHVPKPQLTDTSVTDAVLDPLIDLLIVQPPPPMGFDFDLPPPLLDNPRYQSSTSTRPKHTAGNQQTGKTPDGQGSVDVAPSRRTVEIARPSRTSIAAPTAQQSPRTVSSWTVEEVGSWLVGLGLGEHRDRFSRDAVDGQRLTRLDRAAFIGLGVTQVEQRMKIERALKKVMENTVA